MKVGEVESELDSSIGFRQGLCEGPVFFFFYYAGGYGNNVLASAKT